MPDTEVCHLREPEEVDVSSLFVGAIPRVGRLDILSVLISGCQGPPRWCGICHLPQLCSEKTALLPAQWEPQGHRPWDGEWCERRWSLCEECQPTGGTGRRSICFSVQTDPANFCLAFCFVPGNLWLWSKCSPPQPDCKGEIISRRTCSHLRHVSYCRWMCEGLNGERWLGYFHDRHLATWCQETGLFELFSWQKMQKKDIDLFSSLIYSFQTWAYREEWPVFDL